jgi:hypothetical protein
LVEAKLTNPVVNFDSLFLLRVVKLYARITRIILDVLKTKHTFVNREWCNKLER